MDKNFAIYDRKYAQLRMEVGSVVSFFANLETELLQLASLGLGMDLHDTAKLTSAFKNFSLSLQFTQSVVGPRLSDRTYLNSLVDLISEISGDRNFVAHTSIVAHTSGHPKDADWSKVEPMVGPGAKEYFADARPKRDPMDTREVAEIALDIDYLVRVTAEFGRMLASGEEWPEKFLKPVGPRRPRLAERRASREESAAASPSTSPRP